MAEHFYRTDVALSPGVDIYSTMPDDGYDDKSGTSMATPVVSGVAGLLLGLDWFMRDVDVEQILERTADDRGTGGFDGHYGWGRVNAQAAAEYAGSRSIMRGETADLYEVGHTEWYNMTWVYPPYQYPTGVYNVRR